MLIAAIALIVGPLTYSIHYYVEQAAINRRRRHLRARLGLQGER